MGSSHHHHHHHHHSDSEVNQEAKPEVKPEVKPETHINLKVSDGSSEIFFKIKENHPLRRLMEAFAKRQGKEMDSLRFCTMASVFRRTKPRRTWIWKTTISLSAP
jgi:hypothetical protein